MKPWIKEFVAIVSAIAGIILIVANGAYFGYSTTRIGYESGLMRAIIGIVLLGGAVTYFWTKSKFYKS